MPRGARTDSRADTAIAAACVILSLVLLILPDGARQRTAGSIRSTVVAPLAALQQRAALGRRSFVSHDSLVLIADSIIRRSQRLDELEAENTRLRGLLGLGQALRWGFVPAEALVARRAGDEHTLLLSVGSRKGVERLAAVVAADGLVGMIQQVEPTTSVAITWPHPDFRVSATTPDGSAFGIVTAHQAIGAEGFLLELRGVPFRQKVERGTPVVSSGLGGVYPRGIFIGTVIDELRATAGWERTYILKPAVHPSDVTSVLILAPGRSGGDLEPVWRAKVDSASPSRDTARTAPPRTDSARQKGDSTRAKSDTSPPRRQ